VVKGQAMPAYDPRAVQGIGVTYATTPWAPTTPPATPSPPTSWGGRQRGSLKPEGQVELSRNLQIATAAIDSTGMCLFIAFAILDQPENLQCPGGRDRRLHRPADDRR
jgi:aldehyde:ferredoxin oxidoreductase